MKAVERTINIAFMILLLIPVAALLILQNRILFQQLKRKTRQKPVVVKSAPSSKSRSEKPVASPYSSPVSLRERRKKRYEEKKKALYR